MNSYSSKSGAATILNLRVILLSGTWKPTFDAYLNTLQPKKLQPYAPGSQTDPKIAA